jgi:hypothetical protein
MIALRSSLMFGGALCLAAATACTSTVDPSSGTTGTGASGTTSASAGGGSGTTSSAGSGGTGGQFDPGGPLTALESVIGPLELAPGEEKTQCIEMSLKNADGAFVRRLRAELSNGSHHVIVYRSSATQEDLVAKDCNGLGGILTGDHPIMIAQQAKAELQFPTDENGTPVGLEISPNQMVKLEMHYINTTGAKLAVTGKIYLDTVPLSTTVVKSDLAFWGTGNISVPANGTGDTGVKFQKALAGTKTFALTTHQHHFGTRMRVWYGGSAADASGDPVADGQSWSDPTLETYAPPLDFPENGGSKFSSKGFAYQCEWKNTSPNDVKFGEGFNDEMCFLWHYYYPSQGFQVCMDGFCKKTF